MIDRSLSAPAARRPFATRVRATLLVLVAGCLGLALTACSHNLYQFPEYTFAGRPIPPSQLGQRVMVGVSFNGSSGGLVILDGLRDIRNNLSNTKPGFSISGYSGGFPSLILNFPEQLRGYVYSNVSPVLGRQWSTTARNRLPALQAASAAPQRVARDLV